MKNVTRYPVLAGACMFLAIAVSIVLAQDEAPKKPAESKPAEEVVVDRAFIDGTGLGWRELGEKDFVNVNTDPDTWTWKEGLVHCKGTPVGVCRSQNKITNFEMVATWRHLKSGGNSGIFAWATEEALTDLKPNSLPPGGIEVQVLDHGYVEQWKKDHEGKEPDWFTSNGDVFPVGKSTMVPFPPVAPGNRSFPRKHLSKGIGLWNHYYIRAINGEVRLWVNGEEVSGGTNCEPKTGYLCLESEGSPVEFKNLRIRELP